MYTLIGLCIWYVGTIVHAKTSGVVIATSILLEPSDSPIRVDTYLAEGIQFIVDSALDIAHQPIRVLDFYNFPFRKLV